MRKVQREIIRELSQKIDLRNCLINKSAYISNECPFCGYISRSRRIFRYQRKIGVGKSYCCGTSFKELSMLKEIFRYLQWHKDKMGINYRGFEKINVEDDEFELPF